MAAAERDVAAARALVAAATPDADPAPSAAAARAGTSPSATGTIDPAAGLPTATGVWTAGDGAADATRARLDAVAAAVALDQVRLDEAVRLGQAALAAAERADQPEVQCEALEVLGRAERGRSGIRGAPGRMFERAAEIAERHGLTAWHLRARHELAILSWADGGEQAMRATRDLAARYGALLTVAVMDLSLADIALMAFDRDGVPGLGPGLRRRPAVGSGWPPSRWRTSGSPGRTRSRATTPGWPRPPRRRSPTTPTTRGSSATCTGGCS